MKYESFAKQFVDELQNRLAHENVELIRETRRKVNEELDSVVIKYPDTPFSPVIYLEEKYQLVKDGGYSVDQLVDKTVTDIRNACINAPELPELSAETAKQNLYCVVINAAENEEMLCDVPHERLEDLAVIPRFNSGFIRFYATCIIHIFHTFVIGRFSRFRCY